MTGRLGRIALLTLGVVAIIVGAVFAGQGSNIIPGSSMTGDKTWLYVGVVLIVVGIVLLLLGLRRRAGGRSRP